MVHPIELFDDIYLTSTIVHDPSIFRRLKQSSSFKPYCSISPEECNLVLCPTKDSLHIFNSSDRSYLGSLGFEKLSSALDDTTVIKLDYQNLSEDPTKNNNLVQIAVFMLLSLIFNDTKKPILACEDTSVDRTAINLINAGIMNGDASERAFYFDEKTPVPSLYLCLPYQPGSKAYTNYSHALLSALSPHLHDFYVNNDGVNIEMEALTPSALETLVQNTPAIEIARVDHVGFSRAYSGVYMCYGKEIQVVDRFTIDNPIKELCYQGVVIFDSLFPEYDSRSNPAYQYVEALFGYMGSKRRLLDQILPLFPKKINTFVDLFCGAANVGINVQAKKVILNDSNSKLINLYKMVKSTDPEIIAKRAFDLCSKFGLNDKKTRKEGYYKLREYINSQKDKESKEFYMTLYLLICISFFYIFDFKQDGTFVGTAGTSTYTDIRRQKLLTFSERLKDKTMPIIISNKSFVKFDYSSLTKNDYVYADPPYLITDAEYNKYWGEQDDIKLYSILDELHKRGIKFALSNTMALKSKVNDILVDWILRNTGTYYPIKLEISYHTSMWNRKEYESEVNAEVIVTNYIPEKDNIEEWTREELIELLKGRSLLALKYRTT